jgi:hypothetical protein
MILMETVAVDKAIHKLGLMHHNQLVMKTLELVVMPTAVEQVILVEG